MQKSTEGKKDWLYTVKTGRILHKDHVSEDDEFDTNVSLRKWIGLPPLEKQNKPKKGREGEDREIMFVPFLLVTTRR